MIAPDAVLSSSWPHGASYSLHSKDSKIVKQVLEALQAEKTTLGVASYEVHGTSIEDIFLELMSAENGIESAEKLESQTISDFFTPAGHKDAQKLDLTPGRRKSPLAQSLTIFYKRCLVSRRSWISSLLAVLIAIAGSCIPLVFITHRTETCTTTFDPAPNVPLYIGDSPYSSFASLLTPGGRALVSPPGLVNALGASAAGVAVLDLPDNGTFVTTVQQNYQNLFLGGVSIDMSTGNSLLAWEGTPPGLTGPTLLNLASNVLFNRALNASGRVATQPSIIAANYQSFPAVNFGTLVALRWVAFFGATMVSRKAVYNA